MAVNVSKLLLCATLLTSSRSYAYSLDDFKREAVERDPSYRAVILETEGADLNLRKREGPSAAQIYSANQFFDDTRPVLNPMFQGDRTTEADLSVGVKQQSRFGLNWDLSQNVRKTKIFGLAPGVLPQTEYYDFYPQLKATLPLWRNLFGAEIRAQSDAYEKLTRQQRVQAMIDRAQKDIGIETAYYQYAIELNLFDLTKRNLDRSDKLFGWIKQRRQRNLVDDSDELQAQAALAIRKLEYDKTSKDLEFALNNFNGYRGGLAAAAPANTLLFDPLEPAELQSLGRGNRVSLAEQIRIYQIETQQSQTRAEVESYKPTFELTSMFILQGRDSTLSSSVNNMSQEKHNLWGVGLNFQMPLDVSLTRDLLRGATLVDQAASAQLARSPIDQALSWLKQKEDLQRCAQSVTLLRELEAAQRARFSAEERKYRNGRGTLFFVLTAEQDWISSQAQKWGNELQCRIVKAQTSLYVEEGKVL